CRAYAGPDPRCAPGGTAEHHPHEHHPARRTAAAHDRRVPRLRTRVQSETPNGTDPQPLTRPGAGISAAKYLLTVTRSGISRPKYPGRSVGARAASRAIWAGSALDRTLGEAGDEAGE